MTWRVSATLGCLVALASGAALAQEKPKAPRLRHAFSVEEAVFSQENRFRVSQKPSGVVMTTEADYRLSWKNKAAKDAGKVRVELRRLEGRVQLSNGTDTARWKYGDPPSPDVEVIERFFGPPTRGWDFQVERAAGKVALENAYDGKGAARARGEADDAARKEFEAELREYLDRPSEPGSSWTTTEESPLGPDVAMSRTFTFKVEGERRYKNARCAVVRVTAEWEEKGKGAGKVASSRFEREDLFDLDHGLLAKSLIDSTIVIERKGEKGEKVVEEQKTEIRWTLESVKDAGPGEKRD